MGKRSNIKKQNKGKQYVNRTLFTDVDKVILFGLFMVLLTIPILVRLSVVDFVSPTITDVPHMNTGEKSVLFSHIKFNILLVLTSILTLLFLYKVIVLNYQIKPTKVNILTAVFIIIILLSLVIAPYKSIALLGMYDRNEGSVTYLCYIILFFIASNINITKKALILFLYALIPFTIINGAIGLLNFYGINLLDWIFLKKMILGSFAEEAEFTIRSSSIGTLEQGNYLSGISPLLFCVFFILAIFSKRWGLKSLNIFGLFLSFVILLASLSNSGFFTLCILLPLILALLIFKKKYHEFVIGLILILSLSIVYIPMEIHNQRVWDETFGNLVNLVPKNIEDQNDGSVADKGNPTQSNTDDKIIGSIDNVEDDFIPKLPEPGLSWGSGRGYIWKATIPLILEKPFLGYGLDTYAYHFPQSDINKMSGLQGFVIVDKPHSLYLGIAFGIGILGLIIYLIIISIPLVKSGIKIIKSKNISNEIELLAITFLALAYLIQGIVNDSVIGVSVIFYVLLGVLNSVISNHHAEEYPVKK